MTTLRVLILSAALLPTGLCGVINEIEANGTASNNTLATAQSIPGSAFTSPAPPGVFNTGLSAVTIHGLGGSQDVDFYSFTGAGTVQLSISDNPFTFSTVLSLFDSTGALLAYDDSSNPLRPGSASTDDSYIGSLTLPASGTYYIAVSNAGASVPNYPNTSGCTGFDVLTRPDGGFGGVSTSGCDTSSSVFSFAGAQPATGSLAYTLIVAQAPEPGTLFLMAIGAVACSWKRLTGGK